MNKIKVEDILAKYGAESKLNWDSTMRIVQCPASMQKAAIKEIVEAVSPFWPSYI